MKRKELIQLAINDKATASKIVKDYAKQIAAARNTTESVRVISELLGVSESTVFKDLKH